MSWTKKQLQEWLSCKGIQVIAVTHVGVMYLNCINQGLGCVAPEATVNTNQIHHTPTHNTTNLYSYGAGIAKQSLETPALLETPCVAVPHEYP